MTEKNHKESSENTESRKNTSVAISLLQENRELLLSTWVDKVREEFNLPESTSDRKVADHMLYIIDALISEFERFHSDPSQYNSRHQGDMNYEGGEIEDKHDGGNIHGRQRAGINAYNADKIFQEYVLLRKIVVEFLQQHSLLDIDHMEIITCVIESCSRESLQTFTGSLQNVQAKILSSIVHDIRNPLNAISLVAEVISIENDPLKISSLSQRIVGDSKRVSAMLEDMLLSLSIEGGQGLDLNFEEQNANEFLSEIVLESREVYGIRLNVNLSDTDVIGVFDEAIMRRVIENLISNAFKYGDKEAPVTITATHSDETIMIDVHNFGEPIKECRWNEIFLYLKRFEGNNSEQSKSWGIGLAFVKAAIDGHKGKVTLSSDIKLGTRFLIEIPKNGHKAGSSANVSI